MNRLPPRPTLLPYTTLFRSELDAQSRPGRQREGAVHHVGQARRQVLDPGVGEVVEVLLGAEVRRARREVEGGGGRDLAADVVDRKSTRLNSSHANISYAVFC